MMLGGRLADVVGGKWVYGLGLLLSSLLSLFTPLLLTERDAWAAFGLRIAQGCLQGMTFPALHALTVRWTTAGGRGLFSLRGSLNRVLVVDGRVLVSLLPVFCRPKNAQLDGKRLRIQKSKGRNGKCASRIH